VNDRRVETLTSSMPPAWRAAGTVAPEYLTYESKGGFVVNADLYVPPCLDRRERHPAIVYLHGGVYQQMRNGWHPSFAYSMLHGINQLLLQRGYVVLSVEYRGSTGFGLDYDQANYLECGRGDVEDCVNGARYLASLEFVDPERIGIWGLSYGGTMTLAALAKHPDVFAMGLNLAGIWDMEQRAR
jgi:dipeptidyl aminopeptidase/acylaminoacyl peptidase